VQELLASHFDRIESLISSCHGSASIPSPQHFQDEPLLQPRIATKVLDSVVLPQASAATTVGCTRVCTVSGYRQLHDKGVGSSVTGNADAVVPQLLDEPGHESAEPIQTQAVTRTGCMFQTPPSPAAVIERPRGSAWLQGDTIS
jgi:hypothetical protein